MPKRIQLSRRKGWRLPAGAVVVSRPSKWGNPFKWADGLEVGPVVWCKGAAVDLFREWLRYPEHFPRVTRKPPTIDEIQQLRGKDLACWCRPGDPCHADVLLEIANRGQQ